MESSDCGGELSKTGTLIDDLLYKKCKFAPLLTGFLHTGCIFCPLFEIIAHLIADFCDKGCTIIDKTIMVSRFVDNENVFCTPN